jgi:hypothetical protein
MHISPAQLRSRFVLFIPSRPLCIFCLVLGGITGSILITAHATHQPDITTEPDTDYRDSLRLMLESTNTTLGGLERIPPRSQAACNSPCPAAALQPHR